MREYKLTKPLRVDDNTTIEVVKIPEMKAKHFKFLPASMMEGEGAKILPDEILPFVAGCIDLKLEIAGEMEIEDLIALMEILTDFFAKSQKTGTK